MSSDENGGSSRGAADRDIVVYVGTQFAELGLEALESAVAHDRVVVYTARGPAGLLRRRRIEGLDDVPRALAMLHARSVDALVLDARGVDRERALRVLDLLFPHGQVGGPLLRRRILGLVDSGPEGTEAAFALGRYGIAGVIANPTASALAERLDAVLGVRAHGKVALCLAGGGIEGLLYELGVLRALDACMSDRSLVDFDFFCGISAGAILGALLANGIGPDEIVRALDGRSNRLDPITRWDLFEPNFGELAWRLVRLAKELARGGRGPRGALSSFARAVPTAIFSGRRLAAWLERQLERPGMSNDFSRLRRPLYVGATDQDTSDAVLFGDELHSNVPVHRAVRASCALIPFYPPTEIDGRYYIDGAFSRTTNMRVAAQRGASLVLLVDPLVPVRAPEPGYVRSRGGIFSAAQGLKALINGRFDKAALAIAEMHPNVAFHLFRPEAEEMRVLSGSPMKYFYRREIEQIAYDATLAKIRATYPRLARDLALHGISLRHPDELRRHDKPLELPRFAPSAIGVG
jgi:predicted acylesterase/phospholipase RssA